MGLAALHRGLIEGGGGWISAPLLGILRAGSWMYGALIGLRNRWYDYHTAAGVSVPVISIGNITVGGTGKTPMVIAVAHRLSELGHNPVVVARGYRAEADGANDEELLIRKHCPGVAYVADSDRRAGAEHALRRLSADCVLLDDGFQHRRLQRQLDTVLIDATCPFGFGFLLPRGLLREPVRSLKRADVIVVTRCDQASQRQRERIARVIRGVNGRAPCLAARHAVVGIERLDGQPWSEELSGKRVVAFGAIAHPDALVTTIKTLGVEVVGTRWWPDHHRYTAGEMNRRLRSDRFPPHDFLLTTEKDAVKLAQLTGIDTARVLVVKVGIDFEGDGDTILEGVLRQVFRQEGVR